MNTGRLLTTKSCRDTGLEGQESPSVDVRVLNKHLLASIESKDLQQSWSVRTEIHLYA